MAEWETLGDADLYIYIACRLEMGTSGECGESHREARTSHEGRHWQWVGVEKAGTAQSSTGALLTRAAGGSGIAVEPQRY